MLDITKSFGGCWLESIADRLSLTMAWDLFHSLFECKFSGIIVVKYETSLDYIHFIRQLMQTEVYILPVNKYRGHKLLCVYCSGFMYRCYLISDSLEKSVLRSDHIPSSQVVCSLSELTLDATTNNNGASSKITEETPNVDSGKYVIQYMFTLTNFFHNQKMISHFVSSRHILNEMLFTYCNFIEHDLYTSSFKKRTSVTDEHPDEKKNINTKHSKKVCGLISDEIMNGYYNFTNPMVSSSTDIPPCLIIDERIPKSFNLSSKLLDAFLQFLNKDDTKFEDKYKLGACFRRSPLSLIYHGTSIQKNEDVIVKIIPKCKVINSLFIDDIPCPAEILLHCYISVHPYVVGLIDYYELPCQWILVLQSIPGTVDLFDYLDSNYPGTMPEMKAKKFFKQLTQINLDLMNLGVLHGDLKNENILVDPREEQVYLIDFGSSAVIQNKPYTYFNGTPAYKTPEFIIHKQYDALPSVVWSLGIILYDMMNGHLPFANDKEIQAGQFSLLPTLSNDLKNLIFSCLRLNPSERPSLLEILKHPWL